MNREVINGSQEIEAHRRFEEEKLLDPGSGWEKFSELAEHGRVCWEELRRLQDPPLAWADPTRPCGICATRMESSHRR